MLMFMSRLFSLVLILVLVLMLLVKTSLRVSAYKRIDCNALQTSQTYACPGLNTTEIQIRHGISITKCPHW